MNPTLRDLQELGITQRDLEEVTLARSFKERKELLTKLKEKGRKGLRPIALKLGHDRPDSTPADVAHLKRLNAALAALEELVDGHRQGSVPPHRVDLDGGVFSGEPFSPNWEDQSAPRGEWWYGEDYELAQARSFEVMRHFYGIAQDVPYATRRDIREQAAASRARRRHDPRESRSGRLDEDLVD